MRQKSISLGILGSAVASTLASRSTYQEPIGDKTTPVVLTAEQEAEVAESNARSRETRQQRRHRERAAAKRLSATD